ncbi:MAG: AAA+ ATPase superfamily predicted ATPase [Granulosicoccus sp.]|jgi:AAA+ ATPase superfamily predicted ATPase
MTIHNKTGSPVEGSNFFGREKELDFAWKHIKKGNSLILAAPRRVGKSSFAKKLLSFAEKEEWNTLEINLEQIKSEEGFVKLFIEKLKHESWWQSLKSGSLETTKQILDSIKPSVEYEGVKASLE